MSKTLLALALAALSASAAAATPGQADPYPSSYRIVPSAPVLLQHATVLTGTGERLDDADVLMADGRVVSVGQGLQAPEAAAYVGRLQDDVAGGAAHAPPRPCHAQKRSRTLPPGN